MNHITVTTSEGSFAGFTTLDATWGLGAAARSITLGYAESQEEGLFQIPASMAIQAFLDDDPMFDGWVDSLQPSSAKTNHLVQLNGRSRSMDLIDSAAAAVWPDGNFVGRTFQQIAEQLAKGFPELNRVPLYWMLPEAMTPIPKVQIGLDETIFALLDRLANQERLFMVGAGDGGIIFTRSAIESHSGSLVEGENCTSYQGDKQFSQLFSEYQIKGQSVTGTDTRSIQPYGVVFNDDVGRYRPTVRVVETETDDERALSRALSELSRELGRTEHLTVNTPMTRDASGRIWEAGWLVNHRNEERGFDGNLLIEQVKLRQSKKEGTIASLQLVPPQAYDGAADREQIF